MESRTGSGNHTHIPRQTRSVASAFVRGDLLRLLVFGALGFAAAYLIIRVPETAVHIDGRWAFGLMGFALLRHWGAGVLLAVVLSVPHFHDMPLSVTLLGNLAYSVPCLAIVRLCHSRVLRQAVEPAPYAAGWFFTVLVCYQAFITPIVSVVAALVQSEPAGAAVVSGWLTQPLLAEAVVVGVLSALAMAVLQSRSVARRSEAYLRALVDASPLAIMGLDTSGNLVTWNRAAERIFGWSAAEVLGKPLPIVRSEDEQESLEIRQRISAGETVENLELVRRRKDGSDVDIRLSTAPITNPESGMGALMAIVEDISGRKQAEAALHETSERLQAAIDGSLDCFFIFRSERDEQGEICDFVFVDMNARAEQMLQMDREQLIGKRMCEALPINRSAGFFDKYRAVVESGVPLEEEFYLPETHVPAAWYYHQVTPLGDGIAISHRDITERKRDEERIAMLAQVSDTAPGSITVHDFDGNFLYANERTFDLHGYTRDEFMALRLQDVDAPESEALIAERMRLIEERGEATFEVLHHRSDGSVFPLEVTVKLVDWGGRPAMLSIGTDITERKQDQDLLRASETRFRALYEDAPVGIFTTTSDGRALTINPQMARIVGLESPEEAVTRYPDLAADLYARPERRAEFLRALRENGSVENFEYEARTADGRLIWLSMNARVTEWHDDGTFVIEGFTTDITERRRAEDAYARVCRMASELICVADIETATFVQVNPAFSAVLGHSEEELLSRPFLDFVHPDDVEATVSIITEKLQQGANVISFENRYRCSDGSYRYLEWNSHPVPEEGMTYAIAHDVTDRKLAEAERERLMSAVEQTGEMVMITDAEARILYVNPAFEQCTGYAREDVLDQTPRFLQSGEHDGAFYERMWATLSAGETWHGRFINRRKDGTAYTEDATISPVCDTLGRVVNYVGVKRDISEQLSAEMEREKLEEQVHQTQRLESVGRLAGGIAHDLNNLLVPILGYSELLLEDMQEEPAVSGPLEAISQAAGRARDLVRQLLAFSRRQVMEFSSIDVNQVLDRFEGLLRSTIREDVTIHIIPAPSIPLIQGDVGQLEQVIMNLAVNAQEAMPDGGTLTIETEVAHLDEQYAAAHDDVTAGTYVMLAVSDTGLGIDEETREHIFEPFFTTKQDGGTGLGLATVYGIVKQHGGSVWAYSEPGRGATFKVYLPVAGQAEALDVPAPDHPRDMSGSETVLLVEDHDQVRELAEAILVRQGYTVLRASDGEDALALMERHGGPLHLVLTDVVMPRMSGKELFERLGEAYPNLKVLYMSGYTDNVIAHRGVIDAGVNFIQKPFAVDALTAKVRQVLDQE